MLSRDIDVLVCYDVNGEECGFNVIELRRFLWWTFASKYTIRTSNNSVYRIRSLGGLRKEW